MQMIFVKKRGPNFAIKQISIVADFLQTCRHTAGSQNIKLFLTYFLLSYLF